jgi:outer membrane murein-binding lipoprotein Lpp
MQYVAIILWTLLLASVATAQQQSPEQLYRQINSVLAQDNARLGAEREQLQSSMQHAQQELAKAQARIKELESKQEEKK